VRGKSKPDLRGRANHLAFIRQLRCTVCGKAAPSEAAHLRLGFDGGTGLKPLDRYSLSLCTRCHALQHEFGELTFWSALRIDRPDISFGEAKGGVLAFSPGSPGAKQRPNVHHRE
jgi:hypothetical protein